jgi:hypothetical protein
VTPEQGIHYKAISSDLSQQKTGEMLSVLNRRDILQILKLNPIEKIRIARSGGKQISGEYHWRDKTIFINSARKLGVQYGAAFRPGESYSMSAATSDRLESLRRTLLQETGHHIENSLPAHKIIQAAFASSGRSPITQYAAVNSEEYFAESFVAHLVVPKALAEYDPIGGKMVEQVLALMRNPQ